jgi:hypothetical protein
MSAMTLHKPATETRVAPGTVRERAPYLASLTNPLNLHIAGVVVLGVVVLYLLVQVGILWRTANSQNAEALAEQRIQLKAAQIAAKPLEGLDNKLAASSAEADRFDHERLPVSYSEVAAELGVLAQRDKVRLTRVQYAQKAVIGEPGQELTEVQMDASLSGDYRSLVTFINGLERDKQFFLIDNISLTGQQTGQVNLRLRLTTYLLGLPPAELREQVSADAEDAGADASTAVTRGGAR